MSKPQSSKRFLRVMLETIGGPLIWGLVATFGFFFAQRVGWLSSAMLARYTAAHPVEYTETAFFFIGLMAILRRGRIAVGQLMRADRIELETPSGQTLADRINSLSQQIAALPAKLQSDLFVARLRAAIDYLRRHEAVEQLEDELKYLSDIDAERNHEGYALPRIVIWATPMLGFLGTVIGITMALGDLSPESLVNTPKEAMEGLLSGLSVAFDTTALALTISITLMFVQFLTQQVEGNLLSLVDRRMTETLGVFCREVRVADPQVSTLQQLGQTILQTVEATTRRQAEVWQGTLEQSHRQWASLMESTGGAVQGVMSAAIQRGLEAHTANLLRLETAASNAAQDNWQQWHATTAETLRQLQGQQAEMIRQSEILHQVLQATGQVMSLEQALNQNLRALAGAKNFEDTVMSLSAAIHLLSSRLTRPVSRDSQVKLEAGARERAA